MELAEDEVSKGCAHGVITQLWCVEDGENSTCICAPQQAVCAARKSSARFASSGDQAKGALREEDDHSNRRSRLWRALCAADCCTRQTLGTRWQCRKVDRLKGSCMALFRCAVGGEWRQGCGRSMWRRHVIKKCNVSDCPSAIAMQRLRFALRVLRVPMAPRPERSRRMLRSLIDRRLHSRKFLLNTWFPFCGNASPLEDESHCAPRERICVHRRNGFECSVFCVFGWLCGSGARCSQ